jgi:hypothetical protein
MALGLSAALAAASPAGAAIVLDFEGVGDLNYVNNFYDGGAGTNYGISFSNARAIVDTDAGGSGNIANEPSPNTSIDFPTGDAATMNVAAGFDTGFSFFYSAAAGLGGSVSVYDGLDGSGTLLATLMLSANSGSCSGDPFGAYCEWTPVGVSFAGTAKSVNFGGSALFITYDNITLGSDTPIVAVPEPGTWAMMLAGFGAIGFSMRRRTKLLAQAA